jgi:transposase InsO family protein
MDQGSQFTSYEFTQVLKDAKVKISMDGKGRWIDNRMIDRAPVAVVEIRMRLYPGVRNRRRGFARDRQMAGLLQQRAAPFPAWKLDPE